MPISNGCGFHRRASLMVMSIVIATWITGCGSLYHPAIYDTNLPAPVALHGDAAGTYYAVEGVGTPGFNPEERSRLGRGHYMVAEQLGPVRLGYGAYFYSGLYTIRPSLKERLHGPREFGGAGLQVDAAVVEPVGSLSVGCGIYGAFGLELGPYALLWNARGRLPYVFQGDMYTTLGVRLGGDRWFAMQLGIGLPGLLSINGQLDLGSLVLWGGAGTSLERFPSLGPIRRFSAGISVKAE